VDANPTEIGDRINADAEMLDKFIEVFKWRRVETFTPITAQDMQQLTKEARKACPDKDRFSLHTDVIAEHTHSTEEVAAEATEEASGEEQATAPTAFAPLSFDDLLEGEIGEGDVD